MPLNYGDIMGRKTILKQLVDIVLMLKQFSEEGDTAGIKRPSKYYDEDRGVSVPTGDETPLRPSPLFPNVGTKNYAPASTSADHTVRRQAQRKRTSKPENRIPRG